MRRICGLLLAAALIAFAPATAGAQVERGELRLQITDATGLGVRASGTLTSEAPQVYRAFTADDAGRFTLQNIPFGVYRLIVERSGFAPHSELVDVHSVVPRTLHVELALATLASEIDVTAGQPLVDAGRTGVTFSIGLPQIADRLPATPGRRVLDLVDAQPGWLVEANGVLHPRGSEYQTLFVVDGVPMDENRSPAFAPDLEDAEIQGLNVLTGNFPAEYGRKLGGVVEVTTVRDIQEGFHGSADVSGGSFGALAGGFRGRIGRGGRALTIGAVAGRTDRYLDPPVEENFTNGGHLGGVTIGYDDRPSERDRIQFSWHRRATAFLVPNERVQESAGQRQERTGTEDLGQAAWTRVFGTRLVLNARGYAGRLSATLDSNPQSTPIVVAQDRSLTRAYANVSLAADLGRHQVKIGGDLVHAPVKEALAYEITDPSAFEPGTAASFRFDDELTDREQALFAQDTIAFGDVTASAGLRWDRYSFVVSESAISPRLGIAWSPGGRPFVLRASYDRAFQTPAIENLLLASSPAVDEIGEVERVPVEPSHGHFFEAGISAGIRSRVRVDATAYRRTFTHFADDDVFLNTGVSFPVAFDSARINGVDTKLTLLPVRGVSGFVSYGLLKGTATLPLTGGLFIGEDALEELEETGEVVITQDQRHTVRGQLRLDVSDRAWLTGSVRYGSGLPVELEGDADQAELEEQYGEDVVARVDFESGRVKPNWALDAGLGARLWQADERRLVLRVEVANLANRLNVINFAGLFSGTAIAASRSITARMQFEF